MSSWLNCMSSWSIACQVGQLRVELVKLHVNYAKRENQSQLESHPANIFPMNLASVILTSGMLSCDIYTLGDTAVTLLPLIGLLEDLNFFL